MKAKPPDFRQGSSSSLLFVNVDEVVATFRNEGRTVTWPGEALDPRALITRGSYLSGEQLFVTAHALTEENVDAAIREEIAWVRSQGKSFEWKAFSFDRPTDLVQRLRRAGLTIGEQEAIAIYDLADGLGPFEGGLDVEVVRATSEAHLRDFRSVAEAVFEKDYSATTNQLAEAIREGRRGHDGFIAYVDGTPASIGRLYTNPQSVFAGFYGGGTQKEFRGRGIYRAVVAARAREAAQLGARYLQVDALPTSLPILKRMGFLHVADTWPCTLDL